MNAATTDRVFERLEDAALGALDDYMAYRAYQGDNPNYYKRARIGIPVLSTYGRVRGTRANERQLGLLERRFASGSVIEESAGPLALEGSTRSGDEQASVTQAAETLRGALAKDAAKHGKRKV